MEPVVPLLVIVGFITAWYWFLHKQSDGRSTSPLWGAFTATAVSILFVVAGALGYELSHGIPFTLSTAWTGRVLWSEILIGLGAAVIAFCLWRVGLRSIRGSR